MNVFEKWQKRHINTQTKSIITMKHNSSVTASHLIFVHSFPFHFGIASHCTVNCFSRVFLHVSGLRKCTQNSNVFSIIVFFLFFAIDLVTLWLWLYVPLNVMKYEIKNGISFYFFSFLFFRSCPFLDIFVTLWLTKGKSVSQRKRSDAENAEKEQKEKTV